MKDIKQTVRSGYADILERAVKKKRNLSSMFSCCNPEEVISNVSKEIGYTAEEMASVPEHANLGIGCGNPTALVSIRPGEVILDLGSGAGFDCFLAAQATGPYGRVIGVDITPEMVQQATKNASKGSYTNVDFRVGDIEQLPVEDVSVDLIISNCVINLSANKKQVFREAFRVAKPGGRLMISDIVLLKALPSYLQDSVEGYIACLAGAIIKEDYLEAITQAGFTHTQIQKEAGFPLDLMLTDPVAQKIISEQRLTAPEIQEIAHSIVSLSISAQKP